MYSLGWQAADSLRFHYTHLVQSPRRSKFHSDSVKSQTLVNSLHSGVQNGSTKSSVNYLICSLIIFIC
jgi:hypothetical protein